MFVLWYYVWSVCVMAVVIICWNLFGVRANFVEIIRDPYPAPYYSHSIVDELITPFKKPIDLIILLFANIVYGTILAIAWPYVFPMKIKDAVDNRRDAHKAT